MEEITTMAALRTRLAEVRSTRKRIGFVPTMGFLHQGHLSLVDAARRETDYVVMSIFVNPLQFAPGEDFQRYPRDIDRDRSLARGHGVDLLFVPSVDEIYAGGSDLRIAAGEIGSRWEGAVRPGHFDGVLTIVASLFNLVAPDVACFGQKDIQQVTLIRRMIRQFHWPIRLVTVPTIRDADGLAMSSRNVYLSPGDRVAALGLSGALRAADRAWRAGTADAETLIATMQEILVRVAPESAGSRLVADYIAIVDPEQLASVARATTGTVIALAARAGATRLIDNQILGESTD